jgi:hypothetical protein
MAIAAVLSWPRSSVMPGWNFAKAAFHQPASGESPR